MATGSIVLEFGDVRVTLGRLAGKVDLALVDALARLRLQAMRLGGTIVVAEPDDELRALLVLVGLADLAR
jgi:hypothetical protein